MSLLLGPMTRASASRRSRAWPSGLVLVAGWRWRCRPSPAGTCTCATSRRCTPSGIPGSDRARCLRAGRRRARRLVGGPAGAAAALAQACSLASYVGGVAWLFSLAFVDGRDGIGGDPGHRVRVPPHRPHDHRLPGSLARLDRADPLRRPAGQHPERQLAGARRRPPARRAGLLRPARPDRSRQRLVGRRRGHADRGHDRARRDGDAAPARRRGRRPPGRAVPGLRPGGDLAVRQRGRDVRRGRGVGHRRPGRGRRTTQHRRGRWSPGCCSATP